MDFMERARAGIETSSDDPDVGEFIDAQMRARALCERFNVPCTPDNVRRSILEELFGREIDEGTEINPTFRCDVGTNISFGRNLRINYDCVILDSAEVVIGDYVMIGPRTVIATPNHSMDPMRRRSVATVASRVEIGDDVWIGAGSVILPGARIGRGAVIAAGAVVRGDVPEGALYGGVPAKDLRG